MAIQYYEWRSLTNAVNKVKRLNPFLLGMFFKRKEGHADEKIDVEIIESSAKMAQFVGKHAPPKLLSKRARKVYTFKIPRTFEGKVFDADELAKFKMSADGTYIGSVAERERQTQEFVLQELGDLKDRVINRRELMAAQALVSGVVTVAEGGVTNTADYGFVDGTHLLELSGTSRWGQSASDIPQAFVTHPRNIRRRTGNYNAPVVCTMGYAAADTFRKDPAVMKELNNLNYQVGRLNLNKGEDQPGVNFIGTYKNIDCYEYGQSYKDENDVEQELFPTDRAVFHQHSDNNRIHTGPIYRIDKANNQTLKIINEYLMDVTTDKYNTSVEWTLEQKSLPILHDPDSTVSIDVL